MIVFQKPVYTLIWIKYKNSFVVGVNTNFFKHEEHERILKYHKRIYIHGSCCRATKITAKLLIQKAG